MSEKTPIKKWCDENFRQMVFVEIIFLAIAAVGVIIEKLPVDIDARVMEYLKHGELHALATVFIGELGVILLHMYQTKNPLPAPAAPALPVAAAPVNLIIKTADEVDAAPAR